MIIFTHRKKRVVAVHSVLPIRIDGSTLLWEVFLANDKATFNKSLAKCV